MMPLVSIVLPVYNTPAAVLKSTVESLSSQSYENLELIVIDDSNLDETKSCLLGVCNADGRFRYLRGPGRGVSAARNVGLLESRAEFVAFSDADDISEPNRIERLMEFIRTSNADICGSWMRVINGGGDVIGKKTFSISHEEISRDMTIINALAQPSVMARRRVLTEIGGYDEKLRRCEDYELWLRALDGGYQLSNCPEYLVRYRVIDGIEKRGRDNWIVNFKIKIKYFNANFLLWRLLGIVAVGGLIMAPSLMKDSWYKKVAITDTLV